LIISTGDEGIRILTLDAAIDSARTAPKRRTLYGTQAGEGPNAVRAANEP
jgi:hypothetical protein